MAWTKYISADTEKQVEGLRLIDKSLNSILIEIIDTNRSILHELKLLNARFEEAFETQICCEDIEE